MNILYNLSTDKLIQSLDICCSADLDCQACVMFSCHLQPDTDNVDLSCVGCLMMAAKLRLQEFNEVIDYYSETITEHSRDIKEDNVLEFVPTVLEVECGLEVARTTCTNEER